MIQNDSYGDSPEVYSFDPSLYPAAIVLLMIYPCFIIITNTISCIVLFSKKYRESRPKLLMANIALADILFATVVVNFVSTCSAPRDSGLKLVWCEYLSSILFFTPNYVSALTMAIISYDRYRMFVHTFKMNPLSKLSSFKLLALIWLSSVILTLPEFAQIDSYAIDFEQKRYLCIKRYFFIDFDPVVIVIVRLYILIILYLLPIFITIYFYYKIFHNFTFNLKKTKNKLCLNMTEMQLKVRKQRQLKSIIMQIMVILVYTVCWLPVYIFETIYTESCITTNLWFVIQCLAMSSCALNPFI